MISNLVITFIYLSIHLFIVLYIFATRVLGISVLVRLLNKCDKFLYSKNCFDRLF